jgi:hypothetical protein
MQILADQRLEVLPANPVAPRVRVTGSPPPFQ